MIDKFVSLQHTFVVKGLKTILNGILHPHIQLTAYISIAAIFRGYKQIPFI